MPKLHTEYNSNVNRREKSIMRKERRQKLINTGHRKVRKNEGINK
jgi:hypothetical protein